MMMYVTDEQLERVSGMIEGLVWDGRNDENLPILSDAALDLTIDIARTFGAARRNAA
jgi:hypothetical protein